MSLSILSERHNRAVKAVIYRSDGCVLMQKRDASPGLPFPEHWNYFGGLIEDNESPGTAMERELVEELGCVPGTLSPELFEWTWQSDWASTRNHFFPVHCEVATDHLVLTEGQAMAWFPIEELVNLPLTPAVYENFARIAAFLAPYRNDLVSSIENRLLVANNLRKKNERVFYAKVNPCALSRQQMFLLKELACLHNIPVFRCCLHIDDKCDIHEMLMMHTRPTSVGPLKQKKTSLSYHVLEGALDIKMHDETGIVKTEYFLGKGGAPESRLVSLRLNASEYRSVHSISHFSIFLEVASGPFRDSDTLWLNSPS